jgi:hypothetical protein
VSWVRTWLPAAICVGGVIAAAATGFSDTGLEGGALIISAGLSVWLINALYRLGVRGDRERDSEDRARAFYAEHGRWPDDPPPAEDEPHRSPHRDKPDHAPPAQDEPHRSPHRDKPLDSGHGGRRRR